jgi:hypothetical protein
MVLDLIRDNSRLHTRKMSDAPAIELEILQALEKVLVEAHAQTEIVGCK